MANYTRNQSIEAVQFSGKNQDEIIMLLGEQDAGNSAVKKGAAGAEILMLVLKDAGPTELHVGQYLVKEGGALSVMEEKEFLATYLPA